VFTYMWPFIRARLIFTYTIWSQYSTETSCTRCRI